MNAQELPVVHLRKGEDRRIRTGHLWIYSNEIDSARTPILELEPGSLVELRDSRGGSLGIGYANPHSLIAIRILRRSLRPIDETFFRERLIRAQEHRDRLFPEPYHRLVFGEGDGLPGLVVDRFGDVLVVQPTTAGMERLLDRVLPLLEELTGASGIVIRADSPTRSLEGLPIYVRSSGRVTESLLVRENGAEYEVPLLAGQKTGWFFDHRMNRARFATYVADRSVLDVFSYVGGWGILAARSEASHVLCLDASAPALEGVIRNAERNAVGASVDVVQSDAFEGLQRLKDEGRRFGAIVLDPPAFIKRRRDAPEGERAYQRIAKLGLELLQPGGLLVSASCSFHLSRDQLLRAALRAAERSGRTLQLVEEGHQGPDHPVHPAIPETNYLKALFLRALN